MKTLLYFHGGADLYGASQVLLGLIRSLDRQRYRSLVVLPVDGPLADELRKIGVDLRFYDLPVLRRADLSPRGIVVYLWKMVASVIFFARLCRREKVDIIHTNTSAVWTGGLVASLLRIPHVWQVMELVEKPRAVARLMSAMVALNSSRVFCISNAVREHFSRDWPRRKGKYETLYHGVDMTEFSPSPTVRAEFRERMKWGADTVVILFASRFSIWKGQDVLAKAARIVMQKKSPGISLHFVFLGSPPPGQDHHETELRALVKEIPGHETAVSIFGFQRNLAEWMAASDVFVLASKWPEPNATVLISAMAMKMPVIGTAVGGTVETMVQDETGLLIPPAEPEALANAILELSSDAGRRARMGENGRRRIESMFSMENYCRRVVEEYEK